MALINTVQHTANSVNKEQKGTLVHSKLLFDRFAHYYFQTQLEIIYYVLYISAIAVSLFTN